MSMPSLKETTFLSVYIFHLVLKRVILIHCLFIIPKEGMNVSVPSQVLMKLWEYLSRNISFLNAFSLLSMKKVYPCGRVKCPGQKNSEPFRFVNARLYAVGGRIIVATVS